MRLTEQEHNSGKNEERVIDGDGGGEQDSCQQSSLNLAQEIFYSKTSMLYI